MQRCDAFCPNLTFVYGIATTSRTKLFVWAIWGSGGGVVVGGGGRGVGGVGIGEGGGAVGICTDRLVSFVCMLDNMRIPRHCTRSSHTSTQTNSTPNTKAYLAGLGTGIHREIHNALWDTLKTRIVMQLQHPVTSARQNRMNSTQSGAFSSGEGEHLL